VPALSKWSGTVVGLTLIAIGLMGIYETYFEGQHEEEEQGELKLAVAGARLGRIVNAMMSAAVRAPIASGTRCIRSSSSSSSRTGGLTLAVACAVLQCVGWTSVHGLRRRHAAWGTAAPDKLIEGSSCTTWHSRQLQWQRELSALFRQELRGLMRKQPLH
jgi:hypothetical protein